MKLLVAGAALAVASTACADTSTVNAEECINLIFEEMDVLREEHPGFSAAAYWAVAEVGVRYDHPGVCPEGRTERPGQGGRTPRGGS